VACAPPYRPPFTNKPMLDVGAWEKDLVDSAKLKLMGLVGRGRTAEVYKGTLRGNPVAVKRLTVSLTKMTELQQRCLKREIGIMKEASHPLLVNLLGVMYTNAQLSLVTELCRGGCLFELLHNGYHVDLVWRQQVKMLCDVSQAISYLHYRDPCIIHRDLKSLNLLLVDPVLSSEDEPIVKVADFGHSRVIQHVPQTILTQSVGTHHWMAPEVLRGDSYDEKVDVYSFSMVMFEVICREVPFEDLSAKDVAISVVEGIRPDMEAVPPDCPPALASLMVNCWAEDPSARPSFWGIIEKLSPLRALL